MLTKACVPPSHPEHRYHLVGSHGAVLAPGAACIGGDLWDGLRGALGDRKYYEQEATGNTEPQPQRHEGHHNPEVTLWDVGLGWL